MTNPTPMIPTDEQLATHVRRISTFQRYANEDLVYLNGWSADRVFQHLEALKVDRESLRLLMGAYHAADCNNAIIERQSGGAVGGVCTCGLSAHIALLKNRLGITPDTTQDK